MKSQKKSRFILSRRNQKGQVAVFVALIFQVVFVFFAMLINVGLLVHHKINLQQSTDLAAYYGAMKQAEILNVMAHVNYQIRQSWKLFTWRYRVLGTFGVERIGGNNISPTNAPILPVGWAGAEQPIHYNEGQYKCPDSLTKAGGVNFTDVPFACMGHIGFEDWPSPKEGSETFCRINCDTMNAVPTTINKLSGVGKFAVLNATIGGAIDSGIKETNKNLAKQCDIMGSTTAAMIGLFYMNYYNDTKNKKRIINVLNKNLGLDENSILDIEGNKIVTGIENTLKNNLTEANFSSMTKNSIITFNGVKGKDANLIKEITLYYLNFFIFNCLKVDTGKGSVQPGLTNLNNGPGDGLEPNGQLVQNLKIQFGNDAAQAFIDMFANNSDQVNTLGFEKNPYYSIYYGVKATSEPRIPFLPLSKIKLNAISFAKPFGGTIGPWYYNQWAPGSDRSTLTSFENGRTDLTAPARTAQEANLDDDLKSLKNSVKVTPNFSLYVGDRNGLSDSKYLGIYQGILASQKIPKDDKNINEKISFSSKLNSDKTSIRAKATKWPKMSEWNHLNKMPTDLNDFDSLAINQDNPNQFTNTYMRDIELTVVAPNQFDTAYYSIEPNFYQVYGKGKLLDDSGTNMNGLKKIADAVGENSNDIAFPHDFGSTVNDKIAGLAREFNVSRQLQVVTELFATGDVTDIAVRNIEKAKDMFFTFIPRNPAALLSGWTYNDPRKYNEFPVPSQSEQPYTMQFGSCNDNRGSDNESIYSSISELSADQPATPGNCVTGGRTGYSVKLISSDLVRAKTLHKDLGGPGTGNSQIANPVDENFLKFQ